MLVFTQPIFSDREEMTDTGVEFKNIEFGGAIESDDIIDYSFSTIPSNPDYWMLEVFTSAQRSHVLAVLDSKEDAIKIVKGIKTIIKNWHQEDITIGDIAKKCDVKLSEISI